MRSKAFSVTAAALALCASTALASADDRSRSRYPEYRGYERGSANVVRIADRIEDTAAAIHREYDRNNRRPDRDEARVKSNLRELWQEANQFESRVGRYRDEYRHDSRNARRELDDLIDAYDDTADSLRYIRPRPYVERGMDKIGYLISQLSRYYGGSRGFDRNGRYDRDRYDRDRYDRDRYDRDRGRYGRDRYDRDRYDRQYERDRDDDGKKN